MKPACSIVIRAYNEEKHIGRLLTGIFQQTVKDVQVILVDSGSTDDTVKIASGFPVEVVHIKPEEFSFGYSLNQGIRACRADYVVFASAHVFPVYPDWLEKLIHPFGDPQVALTYGKQRGMETTKFSEHMIFHQWFPDHSVSRQDHPFCNNANAAIRRELWEQHPYDENIPALEDLAWANWAQKQGYKIAYAGEAEIIHVHNETWPGVFNRYRREGMAFKRIYPQEKFSLWDLARLFVVNSVNDMKQIGNVTYRSYFEGNSPSTGSPSTGSGSGEKTGSTSGDLPSTSSGSGERAGSTSGNLPSTGSGSDKSWLRTAYEIIRFRWVQFRGTYLGYKQSSAMLSWKLRQTFYYPKQTIAPGEVKSRNVEPILYSETTGSHHPGRSE
jgi:glycosyltransferase involved in cell wall biosynthesis